jgi:uncharacterized Fe-S cluster-containing protein
LIEGDVGMGKEVDDRTFKDFGDETSCSEILSHFHMRKLKETVLRNEDDGRSDPEISMEF